MYPSPLPILLVLNVVVSFYFLVWEKNGIQTMWPWLYTQVFYVYLSKFDNMFQNSILMCFRITVIETIDIMHFTSKQILLYLKAIHISIFTFLEKKTMWLKSVQLRDICWYINLNTKLLLEVSWPGRSEEMKCIKSGSTKFSWGPNTCDNFHPKSREEVVLHSSHTPGWNLPSSRILYFLALL